MVALQFFYVLACLNVLRPSYGSTLPDIQLPSSPDSPTRGPPTVFDLGSLNTTAVSNDRPTRYGVPATGGPGGPRVTLFLDWHLTKFEQRETNLLILRSLDRLVQTTVRMTKGDEPILNGQITFRSPSLKITAKDIVLLGGFTYGVLATAIRGLGELLNDWGANGVDIDVFVGAKKVGTVALDFVI
ncbi:MAG: hypothetical protein Q9208_002883 [Pyrenodesmia sp. 3 TL-2023]